MKKNKGLLSLLLPFAVVIVCFAVCELMMNGVFGLSMSRSFKGQLVPICCWIVMAVSLNLVVGISGELSLGHAGFMSIGAFTGVVASTWLNNAGVTSTPLRLVLTFIIAGAFACIAGFIIGVPVLRLSGDYLAIVTLAFGEIIRNLMNCVYVSIDGTQLYFAFLPKNTLPGTGIVNGPAATKLLPAVKDGAQVVTPAVKLATEDGFLTGFILILFTLFVIMNLVRSRSGRAIMAVRDNRIAAESTGVDVMKYRLMAFVVSAVFAGMAGALYGLNMTLDPSKFKFDQSITVLVFVVLGGIGNMTGSIISAAVLTILPEKLRAFSEYRMLAYAIVLILVMLVTNSAAVRVVFSGIKSSVTKTTGQIRKRSIKTCVLLTVLTGGLYGIYWYYLLVRNIRTITRDDSSCTGEMLCLVFVPFYSVYWWYTRGITVKEQFKQQGYSPKGNELAYIIFSMFGLGIIGKAVMQGDFNMLPSDMIEPTQQSTGSDKNDGRGQD